MVLALGLTVPTALVAAVLIGWNVLEARRSAEAALLADARAMAAAIDQDLSREVALAQAIGSSDALGRRDWAGVEARIQRLDLGSTAWFAVSDVASERLLQRSGPGSPDAHGRAPDGPRRATILSVLARGKPGVSDLFVSPSAGRAVVAVDVPAAGAPRQIVSLLIDPDRLRDIMVAQPLPRRGFATLVGSDHRVITRTREARRFQGAHATASMIEAMAKQKAGLASSRSLEGVPTVVAYAPSSLSGWTVMIVTPRTEVEGPIWRMAAIVLTVFLLILLVSLSLSRYAARRIADEIGGLEQDALTVSAGGAVARRSASIANIDRVQSALSQASLELGVRAERQALLINELNHRVKNTLATVQALAVQTFRGGDRVRARVFEQRLVALGAAHDLLTRTVWSAVDIREVVGQCGEQLDGRILSNGPEISLPPEAALALCMILHELQTNSLKYGALSRPAGRVRVTWDAVDGAVAFRWDETGGPSVAAPARTGFGTRLIDRLVKTELDGELQRAFEPQGLVVTGVFRPAKTGRWATPDFAPVPPLA